MADDPLNESLWQRRLRMVDAGMNADNCFWIHYKFSLAENRVREFHIRLRRDTLGLIAEERDTYPEWAHLTYHQCTNCPLRPESHKVCPIAANLVEVVEYFKDVRSCEEADVEISTESRTYAKRTPLQEALSGLTGIYMVTSGCPILDKLRPMVYTHTPFASLEETTYRAVSMYCLAQFFRNLRGKKPDWELEGLAKIYQDIVEVNSCFHLRILEVHTADAGLNALIRLDCYAQFTNALLLRKGLGAIERIFGSYLNE